MGLKQQIEDLDGNNLFLTPTKFSNIVKSIYLNSKGLVTYLESLKQTCESLNIPEDEKEKIKSLITKDLYDKLYTECFHNNLLTKDRNSVKTIA